MVGVLKGAVLFLADLMRSIDVPCEIDFMAVSSYGSQTDSSGVVRILKDLDAPIEGRDVLIVEDIIDSGLTLQYLMRNLQRPQPGLARGLRAADQARAAAGRPLAALRRLRDPQPLRDRLRPRPRAALPQPRLRRRVGRLERQNRPGTLIFSLEAFLQKRGFPDPAGGDPGLRRPEGDHQRSAAPKRPPTTNWSTRRPG